MHDGAPLYIGSEIYRKPAFGTNHPLNIVRHAAVVDLLEMLGWLDGGSFRATQPATFAQLLEFHSRPYLRALQYANQLVRQPGRTIVVLVTDFYAGRDERELVKQVKEMAQSGIRMIGLGALGYDARPEFNKSTASAPIPSATATTVSMNLPCGSNRPSR